MTADEASAAGDTGQRIHIPRQTAWGGVRCHRTAQNSVHFTTYEVFVSGIFHLIYFLLQLTVGNWNHRKQNHEWGGRGGSVTAVTTWPAKVTPCSGPLKCLLTLLWKAPLLFLLRQNSRARRTKCPCPSLEHVTTSGPHLHAQPRWLALSSAATGCACL